MKILLPTKISHEKKLGKNDSLEWLYSIITSEINFPHLQLLSIIIFWLKHRIFKHFHHFLCGPFEVLFHFLLVKCCFSHRIVSSLTFCLKKIQESKILLLRLKCIELVGVWVQKSVHRKMGVFELSWRIWWIHGLNKKLIKCEINYIKAFNTENDLFKINLLLG